MTVVLSDLDGVLVDSQASILRAWRRWGARHGVEREAIDMVRHGHPSDAIVAALTPGLDAHAEGRALDLGQAEDSADVVALPGAADLLRTYGPGHVAVVTSCTAELARARLRAAGLPVPEVLVTSDCLRRGKPDPEGYALAARDLGAEPGDCVVLEDAPGGVEAGRAAGMRVVAVLTTHPPEDLVAADERVASVAEWLAGQPRAAARNARPSSAWKLLAVDSALAPRRLHDRGVGRAADVDRREAGVVDQPGDDRLGVGVVAAEEDRHAVGPGPSRRLGLEAGGERVERLRVARAGHAGRVDLRGGPPAGQLLDAAGPELVRGVDDDLARERADVGEHLVDEPPRHGEQHHVAERTRLGGRSGAGADRGRAPLELGRVAGEAQDELVAGVRPQARRVGPDAPGADDSDLHLRAPLRCDSLPTVVRSDTKQSRKGTSRPAGRPRSERADAAILGAAMAEMAERGYARMSVDAVAARAGVSKPTIYLRHSCKADLATAALAAYQQRALPAPTGDTRADLVALLRHLRRGVERPFGMAMIGTVLAEEDHTPQLLALFRERLVAPRRGAIRAVLEAARERGELRADADLDAAVQALVGAYYAHYLSGAPFPRRWPGSVVDVVLDGVGARR